MKYLIALLTISALAKGPDKFPCPQDRPTMEGIAYFVVQVKILETNAEHYDPVTALGHRRALQMMGPACYKNLQDHLGLGRSPLTGE